MATAPHTAPRDRGPQGRGQSPKPVVEPWMMSSRKAAATETM